MKNLSGQESLWVALPMLIVLAILIIGLIFLPRIQAEIRSKASEPVPVITPANLSDSPEVICTELYNPVCGTNGQTYPSSCEANLAGVTAYTPGECVTTAPSDSTSPNLRYILPTSN